MEKAMCKLTLHSVHPEKKTHLQETFAVHKDKTLQEATKIAHHLLGYDDVVPLEQCRLVKYDEYSDFIEQSFEGQESRLFSLVVGGVRPFYNFDLFLEVRGKDEQFRVYKPGGVDIKVLVVDLESDQVLPPTSVRGQEDWTVGQLKTFLKLEFKLTGDVVRVVLENYYTDFKPLENDENTLKSEMFYRTNKIYAGCSNTKDHKEVFEMSQMYKMVDKHINTIELIINYPVIVETSVDKETTHSQSSSDTKVVGRTKVLIIDKRTTVAEVKKILEPSLKLGSHQFILYRVYSNNQEFEMSCPTDTFSTIPTETKFTVKLGIALKPGEYRIKLFLLRMREIEFSKFLMESVCAKGMSVMEFKIQILEDMIEQKVEDAKKIAVNRMRLRKKMWRSPATIFLDYMIIDKDIQVYANCEMYIEILKGGEEMTQPSQMQVYIKKWRPSTYTIEPCDEVILSDATPKHLKQQIAKKAGFPAERVEFAKGIGSIPCDVSPLDIYEDLDWNPQINSVNAWPLFLHDDGAVLYYRDSHEALGELTEERKAQIEKEFFARDIILYGNNMDQPVGKVTAKPKKAALHGDTLTTKEKPPDFAEQRDEIAPLLEKRLEKGDIWYLVDVRWFKQWQKYVGFEEWHQAQMGADSACPGPVDTSALFKDRDRVTLKDHLMEDLDYSLVPEEVWKKLVVWYGLEESSQAIPRKVVEHGLYVKHCKVEVYLLEFKLALHPDVDAFLTKKFSREDTVGDLMKVIKEIYSIPEERECRVWHKFMLTTYDLLSELDQSIQDTGLYTNQLILLEVKKEDGTWPRETFTYTGINMSGVRSVDVVEAPSSSISGSDSKSKRSGDVANQAASMSIPRTVARSTLTMSATDLKFHETTVQSVGKEQHLREQHKHKQTTEASEMYTKFVKPKANLVPVHSRTKFLHPPSGLKSAVSKPLEVVVPQEVTTSSGKLNTQKTDRKESKLEINTKYQAEFEKVSERHKIESKSSQDLATLHNRLHQKEREIETLSNKLSQNEKATATITQNLATLAQQFQHNKEESETKNRQVKAMNQALTVANQEIEKSLQVKENDLIAINQEILKLKDSQKLMEATYNQKIEVLRESLQSKDRNLRERLQTKEDEVATLRESFQQKETGSAQEIATLTERVQAHETQLQAQLQAQETQLHVQETQLQAQEVQQHTQVAQLQDQLQTQATQMQTFCNNALQQMRQQIEREMQQRMEQLTNQMTTMQTLFNAVKPQWLVSRNEVMLTQHNLGDGGYGRVVQATFRGEEVAAKRLHNQIISEYNIRRFVREMQVSSNCHHPNLLTFLGATLEGDHDPIILTELMETNLHDVIRRRELKDHQLNQVLQDIAGAVNYLHCLSPEPIIHRDISSSNVLLRGPVKFKWIAKLSDFGSANFLWHTTMQSAAPGNPTYAAPEVLNPHEHSEKMDVYSFGVLMFEMCSGQAPSLQVRNDVLPTASAVWPDPQRHYVPLIVSCTRRNKDDRPSMSEVLAEL